MKHEYYLILTLCVGVISLILGVFSIYFSIKTNNIEKIIEYALLLAGGIFLIIRSIKEIKNSYERKVHSN